MNNYEFWQEPYIELSYVDDENNLHLIDSDELGKPVTLKYHEVHAICESLKMSHNYMKKQILLDQDYGWEDGSKAPISKVSLKDMKSARIALSYIRKYMATIHQDGDLSTVQWSGDDFDAEPATHNGHIL
jgi:hypothetical protein